MSFRTYLLKQKQIINSELMNFLSKLSAMTLSPLIKYSMLSGGKRLRGALVILSAKSVGGEQRKVLNLALAIELVHGASLILDDIIDEDETRRGLQVLHNKWSKNDAILTAGAMTSLAMKLAAEYGTEIVKLISQSIMYLCEGEHMDISLSLRSTDEETYFSTIRKKSASLFETACRCGSLVCDGSPIEVESLGLFGENFGIAYQLKDDLLDLKLLNGSIPKDLRNGRITLPLIHFYYNNNKNKKMLEYMLSALSKNNSIAENDVDDVAKRLLHYLEAEGSFEYCERKINYYVHEAIKRLQPVKETKFKKYLIQMARSLIC
jgi:geranylgeranyl pyrophosphate synthase